ncbi:MAG: hypothetical protein IT458_20890 [Planctomycetes bacterium]|nr:hypothetical protein [Planctomycetota bacterium]
MALDTLGRIVLFLLALAAGLGGTGVVLRKGRTAHLAWSFVFALAFGDAGLFGPGFLTPYKEFLEVLTDLVNPRATEATKATFQRISSGELPANVQDAALTLIVRNPSSTLEHDLDVAAKAAKTESSRAALQGALTNYKASVLQAAAALKVPSFEGLSPETRRAMARPLMHLPESKLEVLVPDAAERARVEKLRGSILRDTR